MSTYYYLVCDTHREYTAAASRTAGGYCPLADGEKTLIPFIIAHGNGCSVRIVSEHAAFFETDDGEQYHRWQEDTLRADIERADQREGGT